MNALVHAPGLRKEDQEGVEEMAQIRKIRMRGLDKDLWNDRDQWRLEIEKKRIQIVYTSL